MPQYLLTTKTHHIISDEQGDHLKKLLATGNLGMMVQLGDHLLFQLRDIVELRPRPDEPNIGDIEGLIMRPDVPCSP